MKKLLKHPFFNGMKLTPSNIYQEFDMPALLLESEPGRIKERRLEAEASMKNKLLRVKPDEPVMKGRLIKENKYGMH